LIVGTLAGAFALTIITTLTPSISTWVEILIAAFSLTLGAFLRISRPRLLWPSVGLLLALWLIIGLSPLSHFAFERFVRRDTIPQSVDAIVVLAAGVKADGNLPPRGVDRLLEGMSLARMGVSEVLVVTRPTRPAFPHVTAAKDQERIVRLLPTGIELVVIDNVTTTRTEATRFATLAQVRGWRHIALVTSPSHTKRACAVFEQVGFEVSCIPSQSRDLTEEHSSVDDRLRMFQQVGYESAALMLYRYKGWLH